MRAYDKNGIYANYKSETLFDFTKKSSIGCGGVAPVGFYPTTQEETLALIGDLQKSGLSYAVVGNATNILPPDGIVETAIVCMKSLKGITETSTGAFVSAGTTSGELLQYCKNRAHSGAEFLVGIPCSLGGALYMNAGVGGAYVGDIVENVVVIRGGKVEKIPRKECGYAYKRSAFMQNNDVILGANLRLTQTDKNSVMQRLEYYNARRAHLPKGKSMGCVFKNPEGFVAGKLIEGAGLKGLRVGDAFVSETHANFIINGGKASSEQIKSLIQIIKNAVFAQYKIQLEEEIRYFP